MSANKNVSKPQTSLIAPLNQGPEEGGIPSQFPLGEDVQFIQILREAQDFFGIDEEQAKEYFLVDHRTSKFFFFNVFYTYWGQELGGQ